MRAFASFVSFSLVSLSLAAVGCSAKTNTPSDTSVEGSVLANDVRPKTALALLGDFFPASKTGESTKGLRLFFSDKGNTCSELHLASATTLDVRLRSTNLAPGAKFEIVDAKLATPAEGQGEADFGRVDGKCVDVASGTAQSGTIVIDTVEHAIVGGVSHIAGSMDIVFAGGHVSGAFDAELCDGGTQPAFDGAACME